MFYCFHELYDNFGDMNTMHQICDISTGIFYGIHMYSTLLSALCVYVCVCVFHVFHVWIWILHACIYSRTIAVPANVFSWNWPDFK